MRNLSKISNPLVRCFIVASSAFTITTLISALVLGFKSDSGKKVVKKIGNGPLIALVAGGALGLILKEESARTQSNLDVDDVDEVDVDEVDVDESVWRDWRDFKIIQKQLESQEITSFYFQAIDGGALPDFKPGQFLTIKLDIPNQPRPVIRSYSFSDFARSQDYYRLSIKREGSPKDLDVPPGVASNFMHDGIAVGSVVACKPPNGKFFLEVDNSTPVVLLSNGVGITPMVAMAKACATENPQRHVWFVHGARHGEYHAFREEMDALEESYPNLHLHYCYSRARMEDSKMFHSHGYADTQLIADTIIPEIEQVFGNSAGAEYYLCGSAAFMDSLIEGLAELGVAEDNVFFESFGGGKTKGKPQAAATKDSAETEAIDSAEVVFSQSDLTVTWTPKDGTLLELALANGLEADNSCCQGICMVCTCALEEGEVEYIEELADEPEAGSALVCVARPKTEKIVLDL